MSSRKSEPSLSPPECRRQVASILAKGVIRWRQRAKAAGNFDAEESSLCRETPLDLARKMSLTVSDRTRGFTLRGDGDNA